MRMPPATLAEVRRLAALVGRIEALDEADDAESAGRADVLRRQFNDGAIPLFPLLTRYAEAWASDRKAA